MKKTLAVSQNRNQDRIEIASNADKNNNDKGTPKKVPLRAATKHLISNYHVEKNWIMTPKNFFPMWSNFECVDSLFLN